jgi:hypothetical protein
VLERYSRENGYVVILNNSSSGPDSQIVYLAKNIDVTQYIVHLYDQAYPMKTEVPATEPESSKQ